MATVVNIKGEVFAVNAQGAKRRLQNGDKLQEGEILVTGPGSSAQLDMGGGKTINVPEQQTVTLDGTIGSPVKPDAASAALSSAAAAQQVIQALAAGDVNALLEAEAAAAGLAGGGEQGGGSFVQLMRIAEDTTGVNYEFGSFSQGTVDQPAPGAIEEIAPTTTNVPPSIGVRIDDPENPSNGRPFLTAAEGTVFEAGLNPDGTDAASNSEFVTGSFQISDDDGASDIQSVTINGQSIAIGDLVGSVIVTPFGVLTITGFADGIATFTYELTTAVTHAGDAPETDIFTLTVSDAEFTSEPAEIIISIVDDAPSVDLADASAPALTVDESDFDTDASGNFAGLFTSVFGADGPGTLVYALGVSTEGADTGLVDTATGQPVTLHMNGAVVEGRNADGVVVFTISVDASGNVTLDQQRAVVHTDENDHNSEIGLESGLVTLTATITDGDGDSDSAVANIGGAFTFLDDGPAVNPADAAVPALTVDESDLDSNASEDFSGLFEAAFGADGEGTIAYALDISDEGADTGLVDIATGQPVTLHMNGAVVEGRNTNGDVVFTISVDADGIVTLDQQRAVEHADATDDNDPAGLAADLVTLVATITDGDGDTDTATVNIGGAFTFLDDGPAVNPADAAVPELTVDESDFDTNASANFAGLFSATFGADGEGSTTYALGINAGTTGIVDTATGQAVVLVLNGGVVEGRTAGSNELVFTISVDASGNVTLDQLRAVQHADATDDNDAVGFNAANLVTLTATAEDGDGDTASATANIAGSISFLDDGPSIDSIPNVVMANETKVVTGQIEYDAGADGSGGFVISSVDDGGLAASITGIGTSQITGLDAQDNPIYTLTVDADGKYHFELLQVSVEGSVSFDLTGVNAGGPVQTITFTDPDDPNAQIIFSDPKANGSASSFNRSNGEFGVGSNLFNQNESWTTSFTGFLASNFTLAYEFNGSGSLTIHYTAFDASGDSFTGSFVVNGSGSNTVNFTASGNFDGLVESINFSITSPVSNQSAKIKLTSFSAETIIPADDQSIDFGVKLLDGDGDTTVEQTFTVDIVANDPVPGTPGLDLVGSSGDDILVGSVGNDILTGGAGNDIFRWSEGDEGTGLTPAVDIIADFGNGTNTLDLRDLLQGENSGNLTDYLSFSYDGITNSTTVLVSSQGNGVVDQEIVLAAVDITDAGTLNDATIITNLLNSGKLTVDS